MATTEGATRVIAAVMDNPELRQSLIDAEKDGRRRMLEEANLLEGLSDEDIAELRRLSSDPVALNQHLLERVSGGNNTTYASDVNGPGILIPTASEGGATIAGDVVVDGSIAVVSTAEAGAAAAVVIGGAAFGF